MTTPTVAIISDSTDFAGRVATQLGHPVNRHWREEYLRVDPTKVVDDVAMRADVVCIGPGLPADVALDIAESFDRLHPELCVLVVAKANAGLLQQALRAGVRDVIGPTADDDELERAFARAEHAAVARRANLAARDEAAVDPARTIVVVSPKGGAGKTTIATNLAVGLARTRPGEVAVVDLDVQFGDLAAALQLTPEHTLSALASGTIDATLLKVFLTPHRSGAFVLCAPDTPAEGEELSSEDTAEALRLLAADFPFVVVDTSAGLDEHTLTAIEHASDLVLVCGMDVAAVRSLRKELDALDALGLGETRRHLVLNRSDSRVGLDPTAIEELLELPIDVAVPSSRAVPLSLNQGVPLVESDPRSPVARQLKVLVDRFLDVPTPAADDRPRRRWR